ncbi:glycine cleavage system aminomethyltransferase GcvT [bacterium]|nr:glycine cleavage system aminomethyltransferase GcvT [bacterium]
MSNPTAAETLKKTPLHGAHVALGARMVPFGGWDMPVQYSGIIEEHHAVRKAVGLFDVSHMGEFYVSGEGAAAFLARMVPGDVLNLPVGKCLYTQFTRPTGGVVDDTIICRFADRYLLVVNASNIDKDWAWLSEHKPFDVTLENYSPETAMIALQGPLAETVMREAATPGLAELPFFGIALGKIFGVDVAVSRTGYTGEDGFEIYMPNAYAERLWHGFLATGESYGIRPAGLGARDTLRLEAGLPLYGHELNDETTPIESGFGWTVKSEADYLGKDVIARQKAEGPSKKLVGLTMQGKQIAREGYPVFLGDRQVGTVASGAPSPTIGAPIATAFVEADAATMGGTLEVEIRGKRFPATVGRTAFYKRSKN